MKEFKKSNLDINKNIVDRPCEIKSSDRRRQAWKDGNYCVKYFVRRPCYEIMIPGSAFGSGSASASKIL